MKLNLYPLFLLLLIALMSLFLLFGCNAKKSTVKHTRINDTLIRTSLTYKSKPIETNYTIDLVCDTITGKVKPINFKETSGDNSASLLIENNKLKAQLKVAETNNKTDTIYLSKEKENFESKNIVRYKTPLWMWVVIILEGIIIFLLFRFK